MFLREQWDLVKKETTKKRSDAEEEEGEEEEEPLEEVEEEVRGDCGSFIIQNVYAVLLSL